MKINGTRYRRLKNHIITFSFGVIILICGGTFTIAHALYEYFEVSGHVKTVSDEANVAGEIVSIYNYGTLLWKDYLTDANGDYSAFYPEGSRLYIIPSMGMEGYSHPWNDYVEYEADNDFIYELAKNDTCDIEIIPGVVVTISVPSNGPTANGVKLYYGYSAFVDVAEFANDSTEVAFHPDFVDSIHGDVPYSGELQLTGYPYFIRFLPQDSTGERIHYNCSGKYLDGDTPVDPYQTIYPLFDAPAEYTWDDPGGIGWSYFPATPDDRLPNNPNVYVEVEFTNMAGTWLKEDIRINGAIASNDLTAENNHTAIFSYPIPACGGDILQVEYQYPNKLGNPTWFPLATQHSTGYSDADLDGSGSIGVGDVVILSTAYGSCEGDSSYSPCADFWPGGCINVSDVTIFSLIWYGYPEEKNLSNGVFQGDVWFEYDNDSMVSKCMINAQFGWEAAVIGLGEFSGDQQNISWIPTTIFSERSVLVSHETGEGFQYFLYLFGPAPSGLLELGSIVAENNVNKSNLEATAVYLGWSNKNSKTPVLSISDSVVLGDAYPNPFNPKTTISFSLPVSSRVRLAVFDLSGKLVSDLVKGVDLGAGFHQVDWGGNCNRGTPVAGGVYVYKLDVGDASVSKRMTLLK